MSDSILRDKSKFFAIKIVNIAKKIDVDYKTSSLVRQLLRSATSIGANLHEARYAQSPADFVSKLEIALKECYETEYWLELLFSTNYLPEQEYKQLNADCGVIRKMLISSCVTMKNKNDI